MCESIKKSGFEAKRKENNEKLIKIPRTVHVYLEAGATERQKEDLDTGIACPLDPLAVHPCDIAIAVHHVRPIVRWVLHNLEGVNVVKWV